MRMKTMAQSSLLAALAGFALVVSAGQPTLEVGSKAPPLKLAAADGSSRSLAEIDGPKVLVFYRGLW